jgi:hypothetical protein
MLLVKMKNTDKKIDDWKEFRESLAAQEVIIDGAQDGRRAYLITSKAGSLDYGDTIAVYDQEAGDRWKRSYENNFKSLKPWKIELADIDGDGIKEILTAIYKKTHFDRKEKNRMFIFNYTDGKLVKKWTGSDIAGAWKNFSVYDILPMKGSELIFIRKSDNGERISVYYWFDFGFQLFAESKDYENIREATAAGKNKIRIVCVEKGQERTVMLAAKKNRLIETE